MTVPAVQLRRWTREEYEKMVAAGVFHPEDRLELIDGEVWEMAPQSSLHSTAVRKVEEALRAVFAPDHDVRVQLPLAFDSDSEPEPDVAAVPGRIEDYRDAHPNTAALVVEVADSSLNYDRDSKTILYAAHGIPEYWILNLVDNRLEVYKELEMDVYRSRRLLDKDDVVSPVFRPEATIAVSDLLP